MLINNMQNLWVHISMSFRGGVSPSHSILSGGWGFNPLDGCSLNNPLPKFSCDPPIYSHSYNNVTNELLTPIWYITILNRVNAYHQGASVLEGIYIPDEQRWSTHQGGVSMRPILGLKAKSTNAQWVFWDASTDRGGRCLEYSEFVSFGFDYTSTSGTWLYRRIDTIPWHLRCIGKWSKQYSLKPKKEQTKINWLHCLDYTFEWCMGYNFQGRPELYGLIYSTTSTENAQVHSEWKSIVVK